MFAAYVEAKQAHGVLDYDDLLLYFAQGLAEPELSAEIAARFDHLLVDEYQDTNSLQAEIALAIRPGGRGLTVVGDDAQSIYSFRAANVRNILDFAASFDPPARVVALERNYRSTAPILAASNAVIALSPERLPKTLWTEKPGGAPPLIVNVGEEIDQARYVAERVLAFREAGSSLKSQAVLFRTGSHSAALELELTRRNIPFVKFGGLKFLDAAHVKDALSALRFLENPRDRVAGFRVLQLLPGVGPGHAEKMVAAAAAGDAFATLSAYPAPAKAREAVRRLRRPRATRRRPALARRSRRDCGVAAGDARRQLRQYRASRRRSRCAGADRRDLSLARAFLERTHARPARRHLGRGGAAAARRGLPDPVDHPFRQRPGVEKRVRAQRRRRLHPLRSRHRDAPKRSRRSAGCSMSR